MLRAQAHIKRFGTRTQEPGDRGVAAHPTFAKFNISHMALHARASLQILGWCHISIKRARDKEGPVL